MALRRRLFLQEEAEAETLGRSRCRWSIQSHYHRSCEVAAKAARVVGPVGAPKFFLYDHCPCTATRFRFQSSQMSEVMKIPRPTSYRDLISQAC